MNFKSHDEYFAAQSSDARLRLKQIQKEVEAKVSGISRTISYNMPAFTKERTFIYFAAFKHHIGIYPPITDDLELIEETKALRGPKGNLSFPHNTELPVQLIGRIAVALALQYNANPPAENGQIP